MSEHESASTDPPPEQPDTQPTDEAVAAQPTTVSKNSRGRAILFMIVGLAIAFLASGYLPGWTSQFKVDADLSQRYDTSVDRGVPPELEAEMQAARAKVRTQNYTVGFAIYGLLMGAGLGLVAGGTRNIGRGIVGVVVGGILGGLTAGLGGYLAAYAVEQESIREWEFSGILTHAIIWGLLGIGIGLTFSALVSGAKSSFSNVFTGALAGVLGALVFFPVTAYFFPLENEIEVVPLTAQSLLVWALIPAALYGLFLGGRHTVTQTN